MKQIIKNKKAYYYSIDALIAIVVIFSILLSVKILNKQQAPDTHLQEDVLKVLSSLKIGEIDNPYVSQLISENKVDKKLSILEQIAELYAKSLPEASLLAESVFSQLNSSENIGIWFNNELVASSSSTLYENAKEILSSSQMISGVAKGQNVKGYSARAYLQKMQQVKYSYFGGYVGDGNISLNISYEGAVKDVSLEIAINRDFDLYINNIFSGHYQNSSSQFTPAEYEISSYSTRLHNGSNIIKLTGNNLYIAGGYFKISYIGIGYNQSTSYSFPGIEGIINLYDSFYIPGNLNSMSAHLHYKTPYVMFFSIGNKTIFNSSISTETTNLIDNSQFSSLLNYQDLSQKTTPIRLGLYELSQSQTIGNADVVLITDVSGSMDWRMNSQSTGTARNCTNPSLFNNNTKRISVAKCLDQEFVDIILNSSGNRVALVSFSGGISNYTALTNQSYLKTRIDTYTPNAGTCLCCAINKAYQILSSSPSDRNKFVIVMSDGVTGYSCNTSCRDTGTLITGSGGCCDGNDCTNSRYNNCTNAMKNANWSSCRLHNDLNVTVHSVGFGPVASCYNGNWTLQSVAKCGNGTYFVSQEASELEQFYRQTAEDIVRLSYKEQTILVSGDANKTILYPDSHISFNYNAEPIPYGLTITTQTENFGNEITQGSFNVPADSEILDAKVISYSGPRWTDNVYIFNNSWQKIFSLSDYGSNYPGLGDPYMINIPVKYLKKGDNQIKITTGLSSANSTGGSSSDKAIYTVLKPALAYSNILPTASGCIWNIKLEDNNNLTVKVPSSYPGSLNCYFTPASIDYNLNDAIDSAVYLLLDSLDLNKNKKIDSLIQEQDLQISINEISGIPYTYSSEVQVRVWR